MNSNHYCLLPEGSAFVAPTLAGGLPEQDFLTPDGRVVPRALGEAALRRRTALLVGGMLIGSWPERA